MIEFTNDNWERFFTAICSGDLETVKNELQQNPGILKGFLHRTENGRKNSFLELFIKSACMTNKVSTFLIEKITLSANDIVDILEICGTAKNLYAFKLICEHQINDLNNFKDNILGMLLKGMQENDSKFTRDCLNYLNGKIVIQSEELLKSCASSELEDCFYYAVKIGSYNGALRTKKIIEECIFEVVSKGHHEMALKIADESFVYIGNRFGEDNDTVLHIAAENGFLNSILYLEKNIYYLNIRSVNNNGDTVLHKAARAMNFKDFKTLVDSYSDELNPLSLNIHWESILHIAIKSENYEFVFEAMKSYPKLKLTDKMKSDDDVMDCFFRSKYFFENQNNSDVFKNVFLKIIKTARFPLRKLEMLANILSQGGPLDPNSFFATKISAISRFHRDMFNLLIDPYDQFKTDMLKKTILSEKDFSFMVALPLFALGTQKTVVESLLDPCNVDKLTLYLKTVGSQKDLSQFYAHRIGKNIESEDKRQNNVYDSLFELVDFNTLSEDEKICFHLAVARCQVPEAFLVLSQDPKGIKFIKEVLKNENGPYYEEDLNLLLEGILLDKFKANSKEISLNGFNVNDSENEVDEVQLATNRELCVLLSHKLQKNELLCRFSSLLTGNQSYKNTFNVDDNESVAPVVQLLFQACQKSQAQKIQIAQLKEELNPTQGNDAKSGKK